MLDVGFNEDASTSRSHYVITHTCDSIPSVQRVLQRPWSQEY